MAPFRPSRRRFIGLALATVLVGGSVLGCSADGLDEEGQALTGKQAETLSGARFRLYSQGVFQARVLSGEADSAEHLEALLAVDPDRHVAWGTLNRGPTTLSVEQQIGFNGTHLALRQDRWVARPHEPGSAALTLVFSLAADRPENVQLLQQSTARFLGSLEVEGSAADVFRMPSDAGEGRSRLWLDADGDIVRLDDGSDNFIVRVLDQQGAETMPAGLDAALDRAGA